MFVVDTMLKTVELLSIQVVFFRWVTNVCRLCVFSRPY